MLRRPARNLFHAALLALVGMFLTQCATVGYYAQSVGGQLELLDRRRPIDELLRDPDTDSALRERLRLVKRLRRFASEALGLPENDSFRSYADLERPYVVWNVFAAPEFSLEPKRWCFPLVGCLAYRGYFARDDAMRFGGRLRAQGYDVYVAGVSIYSTLGWFDDPMLNTIVDWPEPRLAGVIFHELAHQRLYQRGATAFNESFAMTVEQEGVRRWMKARARGEALCAYRAERQRDQAFVGLVMRTRAQLARLYAKKLSPDAVRERKASILLQMRTTYRDLRARWDGYAAYDRWMNGPLNNAKLASVATYHQYVPAFRALLAREEGDLEAFYAAAEVLAELPEAQRRVRLEALAAIE